VRVREGVGMGMGMGVVIDHGGGSVKEGLGACACGRKKAATNKYA
jgi:hypothetical protein